MTERVRVAVFGDATLDFLLHLPERDSDAHDEKIFATASETHAGGTGLNVAAVGQALGVDVLFFTALGNDAAGQLLNDEIEALGLFHHEAIRHNGATPIALILIRGEERELIISAGQELEVTPVSQQNLLRTCDAIYVTQSTSSLEYLIDIGLGPKVIFGFEAWMTALPQFGSWLNQCRMGVTNELGMSQLRGDSGLSVDVPLVETRGAQGSVVHIAGSAPVVVPPHPVSAVDETGAGDAYAATLVSELARGQRLHDAARTASVAGALTSTSYGPRATLPAIRSLRDISKHL